MIEKNIKNRSIFFRKIKYSFSVIIIIISVLILYFILVNHNKTISHKLNVTEKKSESNIQSVSLKATEPDVIGVSVDHGPYFIKAVEMVEVDRVIFFSLPEMKMMLKHVDWLYMDAKKGELQVSTNHLKLQNDVKANFNKQYFLENQKIQVLEKEKVIISDVLTKIYNNEGVINAATGFRIDYNNQEGVFFGPIDGFYKKKNDKFPITVKSDKLVVNWPEMIGYFKKNVILKKEEVTVTTDEMLVFIDHNSNQIDRIEFEGNVKITDNKQTSYGDKGEYNYDKSILRLTGNVRLVRGSNEMQGEVLVYNFNNKTAILTGNSRSDSARVRATIIPKNNANE